MMVRRTNALLATPGGWRSRGLVAALALAGLFAVASIAVAQAPAPQTPPAQQRTEQGSNWRVDCANDGKALDCRAIFQVTQRDTNQLIAAVSIRILSDTRKPDVVVQLPLGIQVGEPVTVRVDELAPEKFGVQTCTQAGCLLGGPLSDGLLAAMRSGRELKVAFANINKQTVTVTMGLAGFGLAYDKIK